MSTKRIEDELDELYRDAHSRGPDKTRLRRSVDSRRERMEAAKQRITIRLDEDLVQEFKRLSAGGRGYQKLINRALREWLVAKSVKELIREELRSVVQAEFANVAHRQQ